IMNKNLLKIIINLPGINCNSDINDESNISESESAEKEMDIQVKYNDNWEQYVERVVYILKDCKFEKLVIVLKWINGQKTVYWADDAYSRYPQKVIEYYESNIIFMND
ncbi:27209_t:CDS:2, partial [Racocetra persica]